MSIINEIGLLNYIKELEKQLVEMDQKIRALEADNDTMYIALFGVGRPNGDGPNMTKVTIKDGPTGPTFEEMSQMSGCNGPTGPDTMTDLLTKVTIKELTPDTLYDILQKQAEHSFNLRVVNKSEKL